mmetsp:Transcript_16744/g.27836  ORF Transcript_16744/g.27836 Transcript_16744/m.27836 type:complete len:236 (-) Transcript_16744:37-744(-)
MIVPVSLSGFNSAYLSDLWCALHVQIEVADQRCCHNHTCSAVVLLRTRSFVATLAASARKDEGWLQPLAPPAQPKPIAPLQLLELRRRQSCHKICRSSVQWSKLITHSDSSDCQPCGSTPVDRKQKPPLPSVLGVATLHMCFRPWQNNAIRLVHIIQARWYCSSAKQCGHQQHRCHGAEIHQVTREKYRRESLTFHNALKTRRMMWAVLVCVYGSFTNFAPLTFHHSKIPHDALC